MKEFPVSEIKKGYFFSEPAFIDEEFVLLSQEMPFTEDIFSIMRLWRFEKLLSNGEPLAYYTGKQPDKKAQTFMFNDVQKVEEARAYICELNDFMLKIYNRVRAGGHINYDVIASKVRELCSKIKTDQKYLLQVENSSGDDGISQIEIINATHCVETAIVSIIIGNHLKFPIHRLIELGIAAMVHEIGMITIPQNIVLSKGKLSEEEFEKLKAHASNGFEILKNNNFPLLISVAAHEHHERENGAGYPRKLSGSNISSYSKIIAVACSYSAIRETRPHRGALGGYEAVTDLLKNSGKQYDESIIRALIFSISLYPIGQYVLLSNGSRGQVIDVNPELPQFPVVQIFDEKTPDGKNKIVETSADGVSISKPIGKSDL